MTSKDKELVDFIFNGTSNGTVRWEATALENQLLATLRGSHSVTITREPVNEPDILTLRNSSGQEILVLDASDDQRINSIYPRALRGAFNVDKAIDEIIGPDTEPGLSVGPITDEDIPF
jgi:hypothetical protein